MTANELIDLDIVYITLCEAGANRRKFVAKADGGPGALPVRSRIVKTDDDRMEVTGVVYPIGEVDTQGDFITEAELDKAMHAFAAKGRQAAGKAGDMNHDGVPTGDFFLGPFKVEDYHVGHDGFTKEDVGSWAITRRVVDEDRWAAVKDGTYNAFSLGGTVGKVIEGATVRKGGSVNHSERVAEILKGRLAEILNDAELYHTIEALNIALNEAVWDSKDKEEAKSKVQSILREGLKRIKAKENSVDKKTFMDWFKEAAAAMGLAKAAPQTDPPNPPKDPAEELETVKQDLQSTKSELQKSADRVTELEGELAKSQARVKELEDATPKPKGDPHNNEPKNKHEGYFLGGLEG